MKNKIKCDNGCDILITVGGMKWVHLMTVANPNNNGNCSSIDGGNDNISSQHSLIENRCISPFLLPIGGDFFNTYFICIPKEMSYHMFSWKIFFQKGKKVGVCALNAHTEVGVIGGYEFPGVDVWYLTHVLYRVAHASKLLPSLSIHYKYYIYIYAYIWVT